MSNLPSNTDQQTAAPVNLSRIEMLIESLKYLGFDAKVIAQEAGEGIVIYVPTHMLERYDGSEENRPHNESLIRNLLFPFQEMLTLMALNKITGFGIFPDPAIANEVWANSRTEIIGRTLQSLSEGTLSQV